MKLGRARDKPPRLMGSDLELAGADRPEHKTRVSLPAKGARVNRLAGCCPVSGAAPDRAFLGLPAGRVRCLRAIALTFGRSSSVIVI